MSDLSIEQHAEFIAKAQARMSAMPRDEVESIAAYQAAFIFENDQYAEFQEYIAMRQAQLGAALADGN